MKPGFRFGIFCLLALLGVQSRSAFGAGAVPPKSKDMSVLKTIKSKGTATVIVSFSRSNIEGLQKQFELDSFSTSAERANTYYSMLKYHADTTQSRTLGTLQEIKKVSSKSSTMSFTVTQLWISNQLIVRDIDYETCKTLLASSDVASVRERKIYSIIKPVDESLYPDSDTDTAAPIPSANATTTQWGVAKIGAPTVWAAGNNGSGAVVANIDTGVRYTHEALKDNYRSDYGWYDPYLGTSLPNDQNGHGTHTMGIIVGAKNGIGVAPGARWIACKGCSSTDCTEDALLSCGQWAACPSQPDGSQPDCSKRPDVISCSWGGGWGDDFYDYVIKCWNYMNIVSVFASGNDGPPCQTANSPGDSIYALSVGSIGSNNKLSSFSSTGPTIRGLRIKPDISCPGGNIYSCWYSGDASYQTLSGTSMATPHAAGALALLTGQFKNMTQRQRQDYIMKGCAPLTPLGTAGCGGYDETIYPNPMAGAGVVHVPSSIAMFNKTLQTKQKQFSKVKF